MPSSTANEVEVPIANSGGANVRRLGASMRATEPRLWEVQVWPRNCSLLSPQQFGAADFGVFDVALGVDEQVTDATFGILLLMSGQRMAVGPRGARLQLYASAVSIVLRCGTNSSGLRIATRVVAAAAGVEQLPMVLKTDGSLPIQLPRFSTEYRILSSPGDGTSSLQPSALKTHAFVDASGVGVVVSDDWGAWAGLPNGWARDWRPIHPLAAGLLSNDGPLYVQVR